MRAWPIAILMSIVGFADAMGQQAGPKLDDLLASGWEPFQASSLQKQRFLGRDSRYVELDGYSIFLRRKGGVAHCLISKIGGSYWNCEIIVSGTN